MEDPANKEVQLLPVAQQIHLDLTKDRPTSEIRLSYQGGPGDVFTQKVMYKMSGSPPRLKHVHRHEDGTEDRVSQYGGDTRNEGSAVFQDFYAEEDVK